MSLALSRLSNAIAAVVEDQGTRGVAETLGVGKSSVARWGDDLSAWSAIALITLAQQDADVRLAILGLLTGAPIIPGDGRRAQSDVSVALPKLLAQAQIMAAAQADGRISREEARALLTGLPEVEKSIARLKDDLAALLRSGDA